MRTLSRAWFISGSAASAATAAATATATAALTAASLVVPRPGLASGARSGDWCRALTKAAQENIYDFTLDLLDANGKQFTVSDYAGKPLWLNFFASWCPPCNNEAGDIMKIASAYGTRMNVVGIDVGEEPKHARDFRDRHSITYPIALDSEEKIFRGFALTAFPTHVFLDARGAISCISVGDLTRQEMDNEIAVAMDRVAPAPSASPT